MTARRSIRALLSLGMAITIAACGGEPEASAATSDTAAGNADAAAANIRTTATAKRTITIPKAQREALDIYVVAPTSYRPMVRTTGTVAFDGYRSTEILAPVSGPVMQILVQPGDRVATGQALAYVSSPDFAAAVAEYRKARAAASNAQRIADLDSALFANDAIPRRDLEQARVDAVSAAADREASLQALVAFGVDDASLQALADGQPMQAAHAVIRSPIAGTLVTRSISPGQLLEAGATPTFTVADLSSMWVMANVFESSLADVALRDPAMITTSASAEPIKGTVDNIAALVDPSTKATAVRIVVPNPRRLLKKDMYVDVAIRSRRPSTGLLVPVTSVLRDPDNQPFVYVEAAGGGYARRTVQLGARIDDQYVISAGVVEGDRVVSEGGLFLQFGESQ